MIDTIMPSGIWQKASNSTLQLAFIRPAFLVKNVRHLVGEDDDGMYILLWSTA